MGLRYILQIMAMLSDIVFWVAMIALGYFAYENIRNPFVLVILLLLAFLSFKAWKRYGFIAWKRENIRKFLNNAKKCGL